METSNGEVEVILSVDQKPFAINVNNGIKLAKGDIICVINNDSIGLPEWDQYIEGATRTGGIASFTPRADCGWAYGASRKFWDEIGLLDENLVNSYEDYDLFIRAALKGYTRILAPKYYAVHTGGVTLDTVWGRNQKQTVSRLTQCKMNREYMLQKWPGLNVDAVPLMLWVYDGVEIMKEWSRGHLAEVEE